MVNEVPWILIALVGTLLIVLTLGFLLFKKMRSSGSSVFTEIHKKTFLIQFIIGLSCSLSGAFLMFNGELFGDNTTGIARIIGIIGISLIATASPIGMAVKKKL
ncbi:hypothetical protein ACFLYN_06255 [Chloroflexota bacterium]